MCKHKLAIIKKSIDIFWGVMLEFLGTYYGFLRGGMEDIFELGVAINPFKNDDVYDCGDNIDNKNIMEEKDDNMVVATNIGGDVDSILIQPRRQIQPSIEGCRLAIEKLQEDAREETIRVLVQQLQRVMIKTLIDVKKI